MMKALTEAIVDHLPADHRDRAKLSDRERKEKLSTGSERKDDPKLESKDKCQSLPSRCKSLTHVLVQCTVQSLSWRIRCTSSASFATRLLSSC